MLCWVQENIKEKKIYVFLKLFNHYIDELK